MRTNQIKRLLLFLLTIVVGITAWAADTTKPTISDTKVTIAKIGSENVNIYWYPATDNVTPQSALTYYACIAEGWDSGAFRKEFVNPKLGTNYTFENLKPNTKYRISVAVQDEAGNFSDYEVIKIQTHEIDTQSPLVTDDRVFLTGYTETEMGSSI